MKYYYYYCIKYLVLIGSLTASHKVKVAEAVIVHDHWNLWGLASLILTYSNWLTVS